MSDSFFVEQSLLKSTWALNDPPMDQVEPIMRRYDLPEIVARILCARGILADEVPGFLNPTLKDHFPDPFSLKDMDEAARFLAEAIQAKRKIAIFGDFDVDGATSSAILFRFLKHFGMEARIYIPDRVTEGYGPNVDALQTLKNEGAEIVVLLDCGTTAFDPLAAGTAMGLEIVIVDHHEAEGKLPDVKYVVNPKRKDDESGLGMLAACGVTFLLCVAVNKILRDAGGYSEPPLKDWLDLVALGTVCDMVPLKGPNRLFVKSGFGARNNREVRNPGLKALMQVAGVQPPITPYHAGYVLGPRINAGGRIHKADLGAVLLSSDDAEEAKNIAWTLNDCNAARRDMQAAMEAQAIEMVEAQGLGRDPVILVHHEDWHPGLAGLVAGRLKEKYGRPACVVTYAENGGGVREGRGSGRSVPGVHIAQAFIDARAAGLLEKGGGHAMAGGFTVLPEKLDALKDFLKAHVMRQQTGEGVQISTLLAGVLSVRGANVSLVSLLQDHIGPFGQDHPEPLFVFPDVRIYTADVLKDTHVRLTIGDQEGGTRMKAMAFRAVGTPLGDELLKNGRANFHLCGHLKINEWQGRQSVELHVQDGVVAVGDRLSVGGSR